MHEKLDSSLAIARRHFSVSCIAESTPSAQCPTLPSMTCYLDREGVYARAPIHCIKLAMHKRRLSCEAMESFAFRPDVVDLSVVEAIGGRGFQPQHVWLSCSLPHFYDIIHIATW